MLAPSRCALRRLVSGSLLLAMLLAVLMGSASAQTPAVSSE